MSFILTIQSSFTKFSEAKNWFLSSERQLKIKTALKVPGEHRFLGSQKSFKTQIHKMKLFVFLQAKLLQKFLLTCALIQPCQKYNGGWPLTLVASYKHFTYDEWLKNLSDWAHCWYLRSLLPQKSKRSQI